MSVEKLLPDSYQRWRVESDEANLRLIDFLRAKVADLSASAWRRAIDEQLVWVDTQPARVATRPLEAGMCILTSMAPPDAWRCLEEVGGLAVLYKPAGALYDQALSKLKELGLNQGYPVHRIDKMTSGLLLLATQSDILSALQSDFKQHRVTKKYLAFVWGKPEKAEGVIEAALIKGASIHGGAHVRAAVSKEDSHQMQASTKWRLLATYAGISLLECQPLSGRTHQIRAHLEVLGLPLIGDAEYQSPLSNKAWRGNLFVSQHMLHAWSLELDWAGEKREWKAPLSPDFRRLMLWMASGKVTPEQKELLERLCAY